MFSYRISRFGPLDSFRGELESPRDNQGDRKPDDNCEYHQPHRPIRNFEERKDLCRHLDQQPTDNRICDGDFVDVPPSELSDKRAQIHPGVADIRRSWRSTKSKGEKRRRRGVFESCTSDLPKIPSVSLLVSCCRKRNTRAATTFASPTRLAGTDRSTWSGRRVRCLIWTL